MPFGHLDFSIFREDLLKDRSEDKSQLDDILRFNEQENCEVIINQYLDDLLKCKPEKKDDDHKGIIPNYLNLKYYSNDSNDTF